MMIRASFSAASAGKISVIERYKDRRRSRSAKSLHEPYRRTPGLTNQRQRRARRPVRANQRRSFSCAREAGQERPGMPDDPSSVSVPCRRGSMQDRRGITSAISSFKNSTGNVIPFWSRFRHRPSLPRPTRCRMWILEAVDPDCE